MMQITETTLDILDHFRQAPLSGMNIRTLAKALGKTYPLVYSHVQKLLKAGLLAETAIGRSRFCQLALGNQQTQYLLGFLAARRPQTRLVTRLQALNNEVPLLVAVEKSDGSIVLITENPRKQRELGALLPFTNVRILSLEQFRLLLVEETHKERPVNPLIHHATFYNELSKIAGRWRP